MYIWVAIDVNEQVREIREKAENYIKEQGLSSSTFTLPFQVAVSGMEQAGPIVWINLIRLKIQTYRMYLRQKDLLLVRLKRVKRELIA